MSEFNIDKLKSALDIDREPFSDDGVTGLFYPGAGRQELLDQLSHLSRYGATVIFLLGDNGSGKTTILDQFETALDPSIYQWVRISADVLADERFILDRLSQGFQLDLGADLDVAIQALSRFSRELDSYSQTPLLVIDDAQNLSVSASEHLVIIAELLKNTAFKMLLIADGDSLDAIPVLCPFLGKVEFQVLHLPALNRNSCQEYIEYRMTTSGLGEIRFNEDQVDQLFRTSQGNIDKLNLLARELLVQSFPYHKNKKPRKLPAYHTAVVVLLAAVLALTYWLLPDAVDIEQPPVVNLSEPAAIKEKSVQQAVALDSNDQSVVTEDVETQLDSFSYQADEIDYNYVESAAVEVLQSIEEGSTDGGEIPDQLATSEADKEDKTAKRVVSPAKVNGGQVPQTPSPVNKAKPPAVAKIVVDYSPRERWLMSLDNNKFTLQMLGAREEASVQKFLARYPSLKDIAYYQTVHRDKDWYVVVYGLFSSKEGAKSELSKLPKSLRDSKPWPRSIASVQEDIRKRAGP
ncbi:MAG: AAA family ATPase [Pseudomonadales bacterium]|nr:AAA family ATPase [Pseudomonadales bacterium]